MNELKSSGSRFSVGLLAALLSLSLLVVLLPRATAAVPGQSGGEPLAFEYQGDIGWWPVSQYTASRTTFRVVAGDFDGDGRDDVAAM